jgi:hypothetical protein
MFTFDRCFTNYGETCYVDCYEYLYMEVPFTLIHFNSHFRVCLNFYVF